jgi:hypothetical protein
MTQDEIIDLVREAGLDWHAGWTLDDEAPNRFEAFAKLVAQAEHKRVQQVYTDAAIGSVRAAIAYEREACAIIAETPIAGEQDDITMEAKDRVAKAIRARSINDQ